LVFVLQRSVDGFFVFINSQIFTDVGQQRRTFLSIELQKLLPR